MQIVFTADKKLFSILIRYFEKHSWLGHARTSHTILRFGGADSNWMFQADEKGFHPDWWPHFKTVSRVVYQFEILGVDEQILNDSVDEFIDEFVWEPYDYLSLPGLIVLLVWYWMTGKKIKNPLGTKNAFTCSKSWYRIMKIVQRKTGVQYFDDQDEEATLPEELLEQCLKKPELFKCVTI